MGALNAVLYSLNNRFTFLFDPLLLLDSTFHTEFNLAFNIYFCIFSREKVECSVVRNVLNFHFIMSLKRNIIVGMKQLEQLTDANKVSGLRFIWTIRRSG